MDASEFANANADEIVAHLADNPGDVEAVAATEETRPEPRKTVMQAVEKARTATVGTVEERSYESAMSDAYKAELVERGYAEGEGANFRILDPTVVPGYPMPEA